MSHSPGRIADSRKTNVRFATADDLDFVHQDGYIPKETVLRKIENREVVVAEKGGRRIGYLRLEYLWSKQPYIGLIRVTEPNRREGAGKAMLDFLIDYLRGEGYDTLFSSSQADEPAPQEWHRHMGFEESGIMEGVNEGGVGEIFFRKKI